MDTNIQSDYICNDCKVYEKQLEQLQSENERLRKAIQSVPTDEYGEAQSDGCDSNGAWDCFLESLAKWREQALKGE